MNAMVMMNEKNGTNSTELLQNIISTGWPRKTSLHYQFLFKHCHKIPA